MAATNTTNIKNELRKFKGSTLIRREITIWYVDGDHYGQDHLVDIFSVDQMIDILDRYVGPKYCGGDILLSVCKSPCPNSGAYMDIEDYSAHSSWADDLDNHIAIWQSYNFR